MKFLILSCSLVLFLLSGCWSHHDHDHKEGDHDHHGHHHHHSGDEGDGLVHHHDHSTLGAHVHGEMNLSLVVDNNLLNYQLNGAADGMLGFEHAPKTPEQERAWANLRGYWSRERLLSIFQFGRDLNCHVHESETQLLLPEQGHANINITGLIMCEQEVKDVTLSLRFHQDFDNLHKVEVEALPAGKEPISRSYRSADVIHLEL